MHYYSLNEAAKVLQTTPDKVKELAKKGQLRFFQDPKKGMQFRAEEIDEAARARGLGSDPALTPGAGPKSPPPPGSKHKSKIPPQGPIAIVDDDEAPIGKEPPSSSAKGGPPSSGRKSGSGVKPGGRKPTMAQPKSPPPKAGSDSDVRLVAEGSDLDFKVVPEGSRSPMPAAGSSSKSGPPKRPSKMGKTPDPADSGVRIVPLEDSGDSDVKLEQSGTGPSSRTGPPSAKKPSDSDIRLEDSVKGAKGLKPESGEHPITEEIDLDEEQRRAAEKTRSLPGRPRPKPNPLNLPTSSPFELSESDVEMDEPAAKKPKSKPPKAKPDAKKDETDSSSDFELTPAGQTEASPLELSSGEVEALKPGDSDEVSLGELTGAGAAQSGINLQDPADSGISLEQGVSDEIEFELSLDAGATPKPGPVSKETESSSDFELAAEGDESSLPAEDSSSEFELALEGGDAPAGEEESSSEFELSLEAEGSSETEAVAEPSSDPDSDSEFELTLDSEGGVEAAGEGAAGEEGKDIFETDFEVPALEEEESGSEAVVLEDEDTDLETSDFDLALDEEGGEEDVESGSQVVALEDEEEIDEGA